MEIKLVELKRIFDLCRAEGFQNRGDISNADLGNLLKDNGIDFHTYGYVKLKDFIPALPFFSSHIETRGSQAHVFLTFNEDYFNSSAKKKEAQKAQKKEKDKLFSNIAYIPPKCIDFLANELALSEDWFFGEAPSGKTIFTQYPILIFYLNYTFLRLNKECKVFSKTYQGKKYYTFNTGLVDNKYDWIYALCKDSDYVDTPLPWILVDFVVPGERNNGKLLKMIFEKLPDRVDYFSKDPSAVFFNPNAGSLDNSYGHMIIDNCRRLPVDFIKDNCIKGQTTINGITIEEAYSNPNSSAYNEYFEKLKLVMQDDKNFRKLTQTFKFAVDVAVKKAIWNYKTAVPIYYPKKDCISLLLPLSLVDENKVDVAMVIERYDNGSYQGQTILTMNQAYLDSRLLTKPDSEWLTTATVDSYDSASDEE